MRYSLRTLLLLMALAGVVIPWTAVQLGKLVYVISCWLETSFAWK